MSSVQVNQGTRRARKTYECVWCVEPIDAGTMYSFWTIVDQFDHCAFTMKVHHECWFAMERSDPGGPDDPLDSCAGSHQRGASCFEQECDKPYCGHTGCVAAWREENKKRIEKQMQ